jgi:L-serine dehydratase
MRFIATDARGRVERWFASIGGGFVTELVEGEIPPDGPDEPVPIAYASAAELLERCRTESMTVAEVALANERARRDEREIRSGIDRIIETMMTSIDAGMRREGVLPGLGVKRRARDLALQLAEHTPLRALPPTGPSDWAGVFATAVNEENAAGGRIVTAPTNGAAGIVPAVLRFMIDFCEPPIPEPRVVFMLTAAAFGSLIKANAGISGAELGCQGEVGSACAMAAAGLTASLGGSPGQVENAAEIALEHNLGLTCDPVGGFVQIPCIERNAVGAVKAITAASLALRGDGTHMVPLDVAIETMRQTGADMHHKYKETSLGGLAVNLPAC